TPGDVLDILRNALETGSAVWMEYVDQHGQVSERLVDPDRITSGAMVGFDQRAQAPRTFLLHRIRGIALAAS
ncbi:MAG: WYL domain-containing protein, partial [Nocardioides sp.]